MRDVWVESPNSIWFVDTTVIYKTTDITIPPVAVDSGSPATLLRIHGADSTIVATGQTGAVRYSRNGGTTWITATAPSASNVRAVQVVNDRLWYVGSADGNVYKSTDRGASWTAITFPGAGTGNVHDLIVATNEVIWIAYVASSVSYLATTIDGGFSFAGSGSGAPRIQNWPTFSNIHRIAAPVYAQPSIAANHLSIAGTATGGADGVLLVAASNFI